ncbi:MAG: hypothetical protein WBA10_19980 [Elainellaceae cyanobacterium]
MHDNKVRLSQDVIEKAQVIATEWGLKNARAAVEAVFRRYSDEYLYGRQGVGPVGASLRAVPDFSGGPTAPQCEALDELEDLLAM